MSTSKQSSSAEPAVLLNVRIREMMGFFISAFRPSSRASLKLRLLNLQDVTSQLFHPANKKTDSNLIWFESVSGGGGYQKNGVDLNDQKHGFSWSKCFCCEARNPSKRYKIRHIFGHIRHLDGLDAFRSWGH